MEKFVLGVQLRLYCFIGADQRAGPASGAVTFNIRDLFNYLCGHPYRFWLRHGSFRPYNSLDFDRGDYSLDRANCGTLSAALTAVIPPTYYIRKLSQRELMIVV